MNYGRPQISIPTNLVQPVSVLTRYGMACRSVAIEPHTLRIVDPQKE
jgi:hypothetical protein